MLNIHPKPRRPGVPLGFPHQPPCAAVKSQPRGAGKRGDSGTAQILVKSVTTSPPGEGADKPGNPSKVRTCLLAGRSHSLGRTGNPLATDSPTFPSRTTKIHPIWANPSPAFPRQLPVLLIGLCCCSSFYRAHREESPPPPAPQNPPSQPH